MAGDQVEVGILLKAVDEASATLQGAAESVKAVGAAAGETAGQATIMGDEVSGANEKTASSYRTVSEAAVEHGREIRTATKEYKLANIEQMQFNHVLQMTATTAEQWGKTLQNGHDIVRTAIKGVSDALEKATGGLSVYIGAGIEVVGMAINMYAQYARLIIMWGMHSAAVQADTLEVDANTVAKVANNGASSLMGTLAGALTSPMGLAGLAIAGVTLAIGGAIIAWQNYSKNTQAAAAENDKLIQSIDEVQDRLWRLKHGETQQTVDFTKRANEVYRQYLDATIEYESAKALGMDEEADKYKQQTEALYNEYNLMLKSAEISKGQSSNLQTTIAQQAQLSKDAAHQYYEEQTHNEDFWWMPQGKDLEDLKATSKEYGRIYAIEYCKGLDEGMDSDEAKAHAASAAKKAAANFEPGGSPPKTGPLMHIDQWGKDAAKTYVKGMADGMRENNGDLDAAAGAVADKFGSSPKSGAGSIFPDSSTGRNQFNIIQHIYHADEDRIAAKVVGALKGSLG